MFHLRDLFAVVFVSACLTALLIQFEANLITVTMSITCFILSVLEFPKRKNIVYVFWIFSSVFILVNVTAIFFIHPFTAAYFGLFGPIVIVVFVILTHCRSKTRPTIMFIAISLLAMAICFWANGSLMAQF